MTLHTPGPWIVTEHVWDDPDDNGMNDNPITIESGDGLTTIGEASGGLPYYEQSANAALIAAAPELLAELKDIRAMFERTGIGSEERWTRIDSLIARAEGRTNPQ